MKIKKSAILTEIAIVVNRILKIWHSIANRNLLQKYSKVRTREERIITATFQHDCGGTR